VPTVSVIVPARDAAATIGAALEALAHQDFDAEYDVLVVDDGSSDETAVIAESAPGPVRVLRQAPSGPAAARNAGAAAAAADALAFTDADCVPAPGWLRAGHRALAGADLVQGRVRPDPSARRMPFDRTITVSSEYGLYETASLFVRRSAFDSVGGFEDWLGATMGKQLAEDVWFGWRVRRSGARTAFCEDAVVDHAVFRRSLWRFAAERIRLSYFPAMVAKIPELREVFLYRRFFLTPRSAAFDLVLAGLGAGAVLGAAVTLPSALVALPAAVPYLRQLYRASRPWGRRAPVVAAGELLADATGCAGLIVGSVRRRSVVL
jgi:glycosyltransferase involved in cell wall biosynthesis